MHICVKDDHTAGPATWCPTLATCDVCGGLVCVHGCQRATLHNDPRIVPGRHTADPTASEAREATAAPYIGRHR